MARYVTTHCIEDLARQYYEKGGEVYDELIPGTLGYGVTVMTATGYKSAVIREQYENCWSCSHTLTFYNKLPRKYQELIDAL